VAAARLRTIVLLILVTAPRLRAIVLLIVVLLSMLIILLITMLLILLITMLLLLITALPQNSRLLLITLLLADHRRHDVVVCISQPAPNVAVTRMSFKAVVQIICSLRCSVGCMNALLVVGL